MIKEYLPITDQIIFLKNDFDLVVSKTKEWYNKIASKRLPASSIIEESISEDFPTCLNHLYPLTTVETRRWIICKSMDGWVSIFCNRFPAPDLWGNASILCQDLKCEGISITNVKEDSDVPPRLRAYAFTLFGAKMSNYSNVVREISLSYDGYKWEFYESGERLPFEDEKLLSKRIKSKRFNSEMLKKYLENFNIFLEDKNFFNNEAKKLFSLSGEPYDHTRRYSKEDLSC